jgi:hypothetical protein
MSSLSASGRITLGRSFVEKDEVHEKENEGWAMGLVGPFQGPIPFLLSDGPWALPRALPTAKLRAP